VIPIGYESPFRLGEDLSTADVLSRGRLQVGLSAGTPPQGERGVLFAPDLVGPSEQIVELLLADAVVAEVSEFRVELPYEFSREDYEQILHDLVHSVAPALGWTPATT
jgi:hypothetical protein